MDVHIALGRNQFGLPSRRKGDKACRCSGPAYGQ